MRKGIFCYCPLPYTCGCLHSIVFFCSVSPVGANINGIHTDIVINEYSNRFFIILSQYKKLGSLILVYKETQRNNKGEDEVFQVRTIQGKEDSDWELAARYLTEHSNISKPVLYSVCLQDSTIETMKALKNIIIKNKLW